MTGPSHTSVTSGDRIKFPPDLELRNYKTYLGAMLALAKQGHERITLDFSETTKALPGAMAGLISQMSPEIDYVFIPPEDEQLARVFADNCWRYFLERKPYPERARSRSGSIPLIHVRTTDELYASVDKIVETLLRGIAGLTRPQLQALEWSINEILDNVFVHGLSAAGAYVEATVYKRRRVVDFIVADSGIGIPQSMRKIGFFDPKIAVLQATKEGVTSRVGENKGNGLFGTIQIAKESKGHFMIDTGDVRLYYDRNYDQVTVKREQTPFPGTLVHWSVGLDDVDLIRKALVFEGTPYTPSFDFIEKRFSDELDEFRRVSVKDYRIDIPTRIGGRRFRTMIENLILGDVAKGVILSFEDISVISSSFADEVFAKLAQDHGRRWLSEKVLVRQANGVIEDIIKREINSRVGQDD